MRAYYNDRPMPHQAGTRILPVFLLLMCGWSWEVEHPGIVTKDAECSSCHANKLTGKSGAFGVGNDVYRLSRRCNAG